MPKLELVIEVKGDRLIAYGSGVHADRMYGSLGIKTGVFMGDVICREYLQNYLAEHYPQHIKKEAQK
jgi:hypothetical protein